MTDNTIKSADLAKVQSADFVAMFTENIKFQSTLPMRGATVQGGR